MAGETVENATAGQAPEQPSVATQSSVDVLESVSWEAPEHSHTEKGADWFWALAAVTIGGVVASILLGNTLFAVLVGIAGLVVSITASQEPRVIPYAVTARGIRIDDALYPFTTLASYHIEDDHPNGPQLIVKSQRLLAPFLVIPLPPEHVEEVADLLAARVPEEYLEEPLINRILEFLGI